MNTGDFARDHRLRAPDTGADAPSAPAPICPDLTPAMHGRIGALLARGGRLILGIAGAPAAGKSTLAGAIAAAYPTEAVVVPMDGFHLAQAELVRLGRAGRKGAPDTFDAAGYIALLRRLRTDCFRTVYAPRFAREIEEPIANAIPVGPERCLIVTEGNYLLTDGAWADVRGLLDETWFLDAPQPAREGWLLARHIAHGRSADAARAWIETTDSPNAALIATTAEQADWIARWS